MCKLVTFVVDRKTWKDISIDIIESKEKIDYSSLADSFLDECMQETRGTNIKTHNGPLS